MTRVSQIAQGGLKLSIFALNSQVAGSMGVSTAPNFLWNAPGARCVAHQETELLSIHAGLCKIMFCVPVFPENLSSLVSFLHHFTCRWCPKAWFSVSLLVVALEGDPSPDLSQRINEHSTQQELARN